MEFLSKFVEFLSIHILLTPVWLACILQYFSSPVFMTVSILVNKLDNSFVVHLLEPAMKPCFTEDLCSLGSNIGKVISCHHQAAQYQERLNESIMGIDNVFKQHLTQRVGAIIRSQFFSQSLLHMIVILFGALSL